MEEARNDQALAAMTEQQAVAVPTGNVWQDKAAFEQTARVAKMLSSSKLVPASYQGNPQDCFIAVEMAARMNVSPIMIMQNLYVVKGKPSWAGQACMAMINACGKFKNVRRACVHRRNRGRQGCQHGNGQGRRMDHKSEVEEHDGADARIQGGVLLCKGLLPGSVDGPADRRGSPGRNC